jgi:putative nucleotidyltransferase with HDIG domain
MYSFRKRSLRREKVRQNLMAKRFSPFSLFTDTDSVISVVIWLAFVLLSIPILAFRLNTGSETVLGIISIGNFPNLLQITVIIASVSLSAAIYIKHYQSRLLQNHTRAIALAALLFLMLFAARLGTIASDRAWWVTGSAMATSIILSISYDQRFALGMSVFFCLLGSLISASGPDINLFLVTASGSITCCFSLKEIRTRTKLLEVGALAAVIVFTMSLATLSLKPENTFNKIFQTSFYHAVAAFLVGVVIQSLLPIIEKNFSIVTAMTLLDYSDANQPLLKRLAIEAPGTYSHSLLIGSIAEAAAEAIGRNGLLCRVGAYYHDIGKINKPGYFMENEIGPINRHKELSPAMSQLIIVGHVKDGAELAREYSLPQVLRQFIETHHGTTLVEFFYNAAKKKKGTQYIEPSESEFRYTGPKPRTKEAAIVMLADAVESSIRSLGEVTVGKIESVVHNMAMKRLQDGQFDECELSLRELSQIEESMTKTLAAHYHSRIAYPTAPDADLKYQKPK